MSINKKAKLESTSGRPFQAAWTEALGMIEHNGRAFCVLCSESVVCRTSSVKRHFETNHKNIAELDDIEKKTYMERALRKYERQSLGFSSCLAKSNHLLAASFNISHCIVKHGKPFSDGDFIKTAMLAGAGSLFHEFPNKDEIVQRITAVPLSINTVKDRILCMVGDVSQQLTTDLHTAAFYSVCLLESPDVTNPSWLAIILRYAAGDRMREELFKLLPVPEKRQGKGLFNAFKDAFLSENISIEKVVSITSAGAPRIDGPAHCFVQYFLEEAIHPVVQFHCFLHQEVLCAKDSSQKLDDILEVVSKIVSYIMARASHFHQFQMLLDEVQSQYSTLVMYNNVRWLSRGQVLERLVACLEEIRLFMTEKGEDCPQLTNIVWLTNLMFFTDYTKHFNELSKKLQGFGKTVESMFGDIKAFERKLQVFERDLVSGQLKYFTHLKFHLENSVPFDDRPTNLQYICLEFSNIVATEKEHFAVRFSQFRKMETTLSFLSNPDKSNFEDLNLELLQWLGIDNLEMEMLEFQESTLWKMKFTDLRTALMQIECDRAVEGKQVGRADNEIVKVWNSLPNSFQSMKTLGIALLTFFGSSYFCDQLFSTMNCIKPDTPNRLTDDMSVARVALKLTDYEPRFEKLSADIQQQNSH